MGLVNWLATKAFNKFQKENKEWWGNIEAHADIINTKLAIRRDIEAQATTNIQDIIKGSEDFQRLVKDIEKGKTDPLVKAEVDASIDDMCVRMGTAIAKALIATRLSDKKKLRMIENMKPRQWKKGEKHDWVDEWDVESITGKPDVVSKLDQHQIMGIAMMMWDRCGKPYCRMFDTFTGCRKSHEWSIYDDNTTSNEKDGAYPND